MRSTRFPGYLALLVGATITAGVATARDAERRGVFVDIDRARVVRMPEGAQTLIVGNPLIADVTMLKTNRLMVVTGKSFGSTNLILLDPTGNQVGEEIITVTQPTDKLVVMRGARREVLRLLARLRAGHRPRRRQGLHRARSRRGQAARGLLLAEALTARRLAERRSCRAWEIARRRQYARSGHEFET